MTSFEVKERLVSLLSQSKFGASTRHLCNLIFEEKHNKYTIRPGDQRMNQVYGYLKTLQKQGKVTREYAGYWKINNPSPTLETPQNTGGNAGEGVGGQQNND
jgi:hypothetical protein